MIDRVGFYERAAVVVMERLAVRRIIPRCYICYLRVTSLVHGRYNHSGGVVASMMNTITWNCYKYLGIKECLKDLYTYIS